MQPADEILEVEDGDMTRLADARGVVGLVRDALDLDPDVTAAPSAASRTRRSELPNV